MFTTLARAILFLTWPIVLPTKTVFDNFKVMGPTYLIGLALGYFLTTALAISIQWILFPLVLVFVGLIWGHWIAEGGENDPFGKLVSTFAAGLLLAFPLAYLLSNLG